MEFNLKPFQADFVRSKAKFPAFVAGWGTGKTMCGIHRALIYSEFIPSNLGVIFRKEYTDLRDSTIKDFFTYTQLKPNSQREVEFSNNSIIMFRHLEEINIIQNINLGWFMIEQADELETNTEFFMLFGRLRRQVEPSPEFLKLNLPQRSGFIVSNSGDNWIKPLWKNSKLPESELIEATTWDNADVLPPDYLKTLQTLETEKPEMYRQYVMNDWSVTADQNVLIPLQLIKALEGTNFSKPNIRRILSCDPSQGGDRTCIYIIENTKIIDEKILHIKDTMKIVGEIMLTLCKHKIKDVAIDSIGIGAGIADRLSELGNSVNAINSAESAEDKNKFYNLRTEMWWYLMERILRREINYPKDEELQKEIASVRYKVINSSGKIQLEAKIETKKRLGRSPDKADAFVYGIWGLKDVLDENIYASRIKSFDHQFAGGAGGY